MTNNQLIKSASYASVVTAIIIMIVKSYGWLSTDSQSILASLIDSLLDVTSSAINLVAVRVALTPPDNNHRFGHEKFQDLAIFAQSGFFFISSLVILYSSSKALYLKQIPENSELGADVMYICIFFTLILVIYQTYVFNKTQSKIIAADKLHYFSDFLTNIAVVVSLYLSNSFWYLDALMGIFIALYIMKGSVSLFREAIRNLSDEEFDNDQRDKIIKIIENCPDVKGFHDLKTRFAGNKPFIQLHLELEGSLSLYKAHDISEHVEQKIRAEFSKAEVTIHQDPV
ncbi:MAG TPA: cation diffusion facilitator family transporter [Candidatus Megaira endosymbiont of Nemacystus decipiens]|nr:cation diffusion facilitator family transporter [Candidatus Megaera endosymbiont of Nemacystus decipiens]